MSEPGSEAETPGAAGATGRLTPAELDELLGRPILARLATVRADGYPGVVPVWIEWDGSAAWIVARGMASFVADIRREPRVCLSVVADDDPDRRAQLLGTAEIVGESGPLVGPILEMARRMAAHYEGEPGLEYIDRSRHLARTLVRIQPERIISWGSPDWHERYTTGTPESSGRPGGETDDPL